MKSKNQTQHNSFLASALIVSIGGLISKLLGAIYRIPLTNLIGSFGMGQYQLIFPPYILIMTLATAGIPIAVSKLVSEYNQKNRIDQSKKVFYFSLFLLFVFGALGSLLLFTLSEPLAAWQGNPEIATAYRIVSPSILFITVTSGFRGFYQGNMNMLPVSVSQVGEQIVKLAVGLFLAQLFLPDVTKAVFGAVIAITVGEFVSLCIVIIFYAFRGNRLPQISYTNNEALEKRRILSLALPVVLGGFIMQTTQLLDSVMVVNLVNAQNPTNLYGLWTGPVNSLLGLPVTLTAGVAVSALPSISRSCACGDNAVINEKFNQAFKLTVLLALPSAIGVAVLAKPIISLLYGSLPIAEIDIAANLLTASAVSIIFLSILQTIIATCQALGKPYVPVLLLIGGVAAKFTFNLIFLPMENVNIYGAAISESMCYLFAATSGIIYLAVKQNLKIDFVCSILKPLACTVVMLLGLLALTIGASQFVTTWVGTLVAIALCVAIYFCMVYELKIFTDGEINKIIRRRGKTNGTERQLE
ncbi:MAG TPA: polysaccharide biosynthesis protein [Clostridia bacterium]|nr:polysaccharide biosynthesis protein [Clostridia bacterium]